MLRVMFMILILMIGVTIIAFENKSLYNLFIYDNKKK